MFVRVFWFLLEVFTENLHQSYSYLLNQGVGIRSYDLSLFLIFKKDWPWSNRSRWSFKKIDRDRIALVDLLKRSTLSESIPSIFKKQRWDLFARDQSKLLQKTSDSLKKQIWRKFSPFYTKRVNWSRWSLWSFSWSIRPFNLLITKIAIRSKNRWLNS